MIDWWSVFTSSLWLVGLASALAFFSYGDWLAARSAESWPAIAKYLSQTPGFALAVALSCLGVGLGVPRWWERGLWLLLAIGFVSQAVRIWINQRKALPQGD